MGPEIVSLLENMDVFVQEERDIMAISMEQRNEPHPSPALTHTMGTGGYKKILARCMPYR